MTGPMTPPSDWGSLGLGFLLSTEYSGGRACSLTLRWETPRAGTLRQGNPQGKDFFLS